jgi:hypothetical protein
MGRRKVRGQGEGHGVSLDPLRISVTTLEAFRLYVDTDWKPEAELLATIRGEFVATPRMRLGSSGHCALENKEPSHIAEAGHKCDGFLWSPETVAQIRPYYPTGGLSEIKGTRDWQIGGRTVTLSAKGDHFIGTEQIEAKFSLSPFDPDRYLPSLQWKSYALIFGPTSVKYVVFACDLDEDSGEVTVKEAHPLTLYPYAGMESDVTEYLSRFVEYVDARGLAQYLRPKWAA